MFQVVVLPPASSMRSVEELRRLHDPAFHRVAAHVALLPSFDAADAALLARFGAFRGGGPFEVEFGPPAVSGSALSLPVARGAEPLRALRDALAHSLLGALGEPPGGEPSLRVGLFGSDAERELARRALATAPAPGPFVVREVTLLVEDVRGLWHAVRRSGLGPRVV